MKTVTWHEASHLLANQNILWKLSTLLFMFNLKTELGEQSLLNKDIVCCPLPCLCFFSFSVCVGMEKNIFSGNSLLRSLTPVHCQFTLSVHSFGRGWPHASLETKNCSSYNTDNCHLLWTGISGF